MPRWKNLLDRRGTGTHYADRLHRILGVCRDCGLLWHNERIAQRDGRTEVRRVDDIAPTERVVVTPRDEKYGLQVNPRVLKRLVTLGPQFAYALNVPDVSVEVDGNIVYVRVPRPEAEQTDTLLYQDAWDAAPDIPVGSLLLGIDEEQHQLVLELVAPTNVHAAVIGMTGSGKSTLMRTMILSAQMIGGAQVALFDPSGGFEPLSGHPSVWRGGLFRAPDACEAGLRVLAETIGRRHGGLTYVFIDEVPELVMQRPRIKDYLARLTQAGRHAGLHVVLGDQHPLARDLGPTTMRNVPVRLVGRVADRSAAYNATGRNDSGAESLRGRGDFVAVNGSQRQRFQAAMVPPSLLQEWRRRYPPRAVRLPASAAGAVSPPQVTRSGGRSLDDIPPFVVHEIRRYHARHGRLPSSNWVYRYTRSRLPTGGFGRAKAERALQAAQGSLESRIAGT
jgi:hypothetical protein